MNAPALQPAGHPRHNRDVVLLERLRWAVRAVLLLGVAASIAANVLHARPNLISQLIAAWPPLALMLTVELISRVPTDRRSLAATRLISAATIAGIAAWVSYWHMVGVAARYGETSANANYLLPLSVDGLVVVASISLVEIAGRIDRSQRTPARAPARNGSPIPNTALSMTTTLDDTPPSATVPAAPPGAPANVSSHIATPTAAAVGRPKERGTAAMSATANGVTHTLRSSQTPHSLGQDRNGHLQRPDDTDTRDGTADTRKQAERDPAGPPTAVDDEPAASPSERPHGDVPLPAQHLDDDTSPIQNPHPRPRPAGPEPDLRAAAQHSGHDHRHPHAAVTNSDRTDAADQPRPSDAGSEAVADAQHLNEDDHAIPSGTAAAVAYWYHRHPQMHPADIAAKIGKSERTVRRHWPPPAPVTDGHADILADQLPRP